MSLARVKTVKAAKAYTCGKCRAEIAKGDQYRWYKVGFRSRTRNIRCLETGCAPRSSELESSKLADAYGALEDASDAVASADTIEDLQAALEEAAGRIRDVASEYTEAGDAMGDAGYEMTERGEALDAAADELESVDFDDVPAEADCEECDGTGKAECGTCEGDGSVEVECSACSGTGGEAFVCEECSGAGVVDDECSDCSGEGRVEECETCDGSGQVEVEPDIEDARELAQAAIDDFEMP